MNDQLDHPAYPHLATSHPIECCPWIYGSDLGILHLSTLLQCINTRQTVPLRLFRQLLLADPPSEMVSARGNLYTLLLDESPADTWSTDGHIVAMFVSTGITAWLIKQLADLHRSLLPS